MPRIGLNCSLIDMGDQYKAKAVCHLKYVDAVAGAGGVPVIIPPLQNADAIRRALEGLDGFFLIGGPDYLPEHYGGHAQPASDLMHERRHKFDLMLAQILLEETSKPVLGVCGGHQLLNIATGGGLVQDLKTEWQADDKKASTQLHADGERAGSSQAGENYRHEVRVKPGSLVEKIVGARKLLTNSYHHQAVHPERIGKGFVASAWSDDGVIEAIEREGERFVLGIEWHPERQFEEAQHRAIFEALVAAAK